MKILLFTLSVFAGVCAWSVSANAGVVVFAESPQASIVGSDTPIVLKARLTEPINALKISVLISPKSVEVVRFDDADSVVRLWLQRGVPTDEGVVLEGVIPGGVGPAFTDVVNLGTVWVRPSAIGQVRITFADAEVYLNQPNAVLSDVKTESLLVSVGPSDGTPPEDTVPSEVVDPYVRVVREENIAGGARTLLFDIKTDRGTADVVRIRERWLGIWGTWRDAVNPSTLSDRWGVSILDVALSDAVGGARVATVVPLPLKIIWSIVALGILGIASRLFILRH